MEEFLGAILTAIAELLFEFLLELIIEVIAAVIAGFFRDLRDSVEPMSPVLAGGLYFALGLGVGGASLFLVPHPVFHPSRFHGISLLVSPILTGMVMSLIGSIIRRKGREPVRIESFGYGFAFALGMAIVRLVFAR